VPPTPALPGAVLAAVVLISLTLPLLGWAVLARPERVQRQIRDNLTRRLEPADTAPTGPAVAERRSLLVGVVRRLTLPGTEQRLERLLARAGRPAAWPVERLLAAKVLLPLVVAVLGALYLQATPRPLMALLVMVALVVTHFLPELLLHSRGQERSAAVTLALADTLDQMTIAVEAGLGFDSAMARAGRNGKGPLADELVRTLQDIQMGHSRRLAYEGLAERTNVADLRRFVRAVLQADAYGIAVADVLRTQASEMRMKRRQRAEEKAMQIPVKVIFPLMLCILPCLFIVLLGPAALDIVAAFS
jgi:tight adherence protein C